MTTGKALLSVAAGIAAGAILGILFAPDKGKDTRKKIVKKGEDLTDAVSDKIDQKFEEFTKSIFGKFYNLKTPKEPMRKQEMSEQ